MTVILWLQQNLQGPFWENFWYLASKIYSEEAFLALMPIIFWVTDRSFSRYFATLFLGNIWLNAFFKGIAGTDRPSGNGIRVRLVDTDGGFSFPSGHAEGSAAIFTALARRIRQRWFTGIALAAAFVVGVARLFLGLHWPADILGGWAIGFALAYGLAAAWPTLARWVEAIPFGPRLALALLVPALMLLAWTNLPFIARIGLASQYSALGALAGVWFGTILEERYVGFDPSGGLAWHLTKCVIGIALVMAVRYGLKPLLPAGDWFTFVRYCGIGLTVSFVAPWVFGYLPGRPAVRARAA